MRANSGPQAGVQMREACVQSSRPRVYALSKCGFDPVSMEDGSP